MSTAVDVSKGGKHQEPRQMQLLHMGNVACCALQVVTDAMSSVYADVLHCGYASTRHSTSSRSQQTDHFQCSSSSHHCLFGDLVVPRQCCWLSNSMQAVMVSQVEGSSAYILAWATGKIRLTMSFG